MMVRMMLIIAVSELNIKRIWLVVMKEIYKIIRFLDWIFLFRLEFFLRLFLNDYLSCMRLFSNLNRLLNIDWRFLWHWIILVKFLLDEICNSHWLIWSILTQLLFNSLCNLLPLDISL